MPPGDHDLVPARCEANGGRDVRVFFVPIVDRHAPAFPQLRDADYEYTIPRLHHEQEAAARQALRRVPDCRPIGGSVSVDDAFETPSAGPARQLRRVGEARARCGAARHVGRRTGPERSDGEDGGNHDRVPRGLHHAILSPLRHVV